MLADRLAGDSGGLALSGLPRGVEPYVAVQSLHLEYEVADSRL